MSWIQQETNSIDANNVYRFDTANWNSVASNYDGTKFIACSQSILGSVWIYNGTIWEEQTIDDTNWVSVASNSDGTKFIACTASYIWIYNNNIWARQTIDGTFIWNSVASNSTGTKFIACDGLGYIWIYSGSSWARQTISSDFLSIVASNSDGTKFIACGNDSVWIYNGSSWIKQTVGSGIPEWSSVALNGDGTKFIASSNDYNGFYGYIYTLSLTIANICFPSGTPVLTDQGLIAIDMIDIDVNTIHDKKIIDITKTVSKETFLVCFEKDALGLNMPSQETIISPGHTLLYEGEMHAAKWFLEKFPKVKSIPYTGEPLYNVLLEEHDVMNVNNLICETLLPDNPIAKFYTKQCKLSPKDRDIMINVLQGCLDRNDISTYNQI